MKLLVTLFYIPKRQDIFPRRKSGQKSEQKLGQYSDILDISRYSTYRFTQIFNSNILTLSALQIM